MFDEIFIAGGGLIGSSIARALRHYNRAKKIVIYDTDKDVRARLHALDLADVCSSVPDKIEAEIVIMAVPPAKIAKLAQTLMPVMKKGAILTDVGSIKRAVLDEIIPYVPEDIIFIGGHPIAGTEESGPEAGFATLFANRWCILTPEDETSFEAKRLKAFWEGLGSTVSFMGADHHDLVLATTSHLPHLIAYALVGTATDMETVTQNEVVKYSAGGFRDFTRIAASNPEMWRDVFLGNKDAVLEVLGRYIEDLTALKRAIRWENGPQLLGEFSRARDIRTRIIDAGQECKEPNFGRDKS